MAWSEQRKVNPTPSSTSNTAQRRVRLQPPRLQAPRLQSPRPGLPGGQTVSTPTHPAATHPDAPPAVEAPECGNEAASSSGLLNGMSGWVKTCGAADTGNEAPAVSRANPWGAKIERDAQGRPTTVETTEGRRRDYERFDDGSISAMRVRTKDGRTTSWTRESAQSDQWTARNDQGRVITRWRGEMDVNADGVHSVRNAGEQGSTSHLPDGSSSPSRLENGRLTVRDDKGNVSYESRSDGSATFTRDGRRVSVDAAGGLQSISTPDGERRFERRDGALTRVVDVDAKGAETERFSARDGSTAVLDEKSGDVTVTHPFGKTRHNADGSTVSSDTDGTVLSVVRKDGTARDFLYQCDETGGNKRLAAITDTSVSPKGPQRTTWTREQGGDAFTSIDDKGRVRPARSDVKVAENGDYTYTDPKTGTTRTAKVGSVGGATAGGYASDSVETARQNLLDTLGGQMSPERLERFKNMMTAFERRMGDRAMQRMTAGQDAAKVHPEIEATIGNTYDQLNEMVSTPQGRAEVYNQQMRTFLAENFMLFAADPGTYNQGNHGSCWMQSGTIANGWTNHADGLARFVKEVSLTGQFNSPWANDGKGRVFNFNRGIFALRQGQEESRWSFDRAQTSSARSPIGMILDEGQSSMLGRGSSWGGTYGETSRTQYWLTGDTPAREGGNMRKTLLEKGAYINFWPGHMLTQQLRREGDHFIVVQDNQWGNGSDYTLGRVDNLARWDYRGDRGRRFEHFKPSSNPDENPVGPYIPGPAPVGPGTDGSLVSNDGGQVGPVGPGRGPSPTPLTPLVGMGGGFRGAANPGLPPIQSAADALHLILMMYAVMTAQESGPQGQDQINAMLSGPDGPRVKALMAHMSTAQG